MTDRHADAGTDPELGSIEREIYVEARPETVFAVVSEPRHMSAWWPDDAQYEVAPGAEGQIVFGDPGDGGSASGFTVMDVDPPRSFSFRWTHEVGTVATAGTSLLVTFTLVPAGTGTLLRMRETGFRERGWEAAVLEHEYAQHVWGWDLFLPRLAPYVASLEADA